MKILGNSVRGLNPHQKQLFYRSCVLLIALYGFQLWYYNKAPLSYPLEMLGKIQRKAAIWILETFKTSLLFSIESIIGLIIINLYLHKLSERLQLHAHSLSTNHILCSLIESKANNSTKLHLLFLGFLSKRQCQLIKSLIVNMDNCFNENFPLFDPLNSKFSPGYRIINTFSSCFSFHSFSKCNEDSLKSHVHRLNELAIESSNNPSHALVITDTSIKNNIATSISHMHIYNKPITKTLHHVVNVSSIEAKLFAIRCSINQSTNSSGISKIIVVTNSIHTMKNFLTHLPILTRATQFLFLRNFKLFSLAIRRT